jgi:hypothetical protein
MGRPAVPFKRRLELDADEEVALQILVALASVALSESSLVLQQHVALGVAAASLWLVDIGEERNKRWKYNSRQLFNEKKLGSEHDVKALCRFVPSELDEIMRLLRIPEWLSATGRGGHKYPGKLCLLCLLGVLAQENTVTTWSARLGLGHPSDVSRAYLTLLDFLEKPIRRASDIMNYTSYFEESERVFVDRGLPEGIFAALDGKLFRLADAQTSSGWRQMTSGHGDKQGVNYIAACLASGLFIMFNGPVIGSEHDATSFRITGTYEDIESAIAKLVSTAETSEQQERFGR